MLITGILPGRLNSTLWDLTYGEVCRQDPAVQAMTREQGVTRCIDERSFVGPPAKYNLNRARLSAAVRFRLYSHLSGMFGTATYDKKSLPYRVAHCRPSGVYYNPDVMNFRFTCRNYHACPNCLYRKNLDLLTRVDKLSSTNGFTSLVVGTVTVTSAYRTITERDTSLLAHATARARACLQSDVVVVYKRAIVAPPDDSFHPLAVRSTIIGLSHSSIYKTEERLLLLEDIDASNWKVTSAAAPSEYLLKEFRDSFKFYPAVFSSRDHALFTNIATASSAMRLSFSRD